MNLEFSLNQWVSILHCSIYLVNKKNQIEKIFGDVDRDNNRLFTEPGFLEKIISHVNEEYPYIYSDKGAILCAAFGNDENKIIVGPVRIIKNLDAVINEIDGTRYFTRKMARPIAFCDIKVFGAGISIMFQSFSGMTITPEEIWKKNGVEGIANDEIKDHIQKVFFRRQETELPHNPYDQEKRELDSIRRGDKEMLRRSIEETYHGQVGKLSDNAIRQAKNIAICVIALASRAAIDGGLLPEEAFSIVDAYIMKIEEMTNIIRIDSAMRQAEYEFAELVNKNNQSHKKNEIVEKTKSFIFQNLHSDIVIGDIGMQVGVAPAYLSTLFRKTEGITIQQYIRKQKIRMAENMLRYSDYDVKSIASYLAFCSQSHFGKVFKDETGLTPLKYREKFGRKENDKIYDS